jgi:hypothetical protein
MRLYYWSEIETLEDIQNYGRVVAFARDRESAIALAVGDVSPRYQAALREELGRKTPLVFEGEVGFAFFG